MPPSYLTNHGRDFVHRTCRDQILEADPEWDDLAEVPAK